MRANVFLITLLVLGCVFSIESQQPLVGSIRGTIRDQRQVPVPYATLTATNTDAVDPESHRRTTSADKQGVYQFVEVPPGHYSILVTKSGRRDYRIPLVTVRPGETVNMPDIQMSPADR